MSGVVQWWRWEMHRTIDVTGFIRFIIVERFVKATILVVAGVGLLIAGETTDLHTYALNFQEQLNLDAYKPAWERLFNWAIQHVASVNRVNTIAIGAILYGLLEGLEGVGLALRRRWAEYLLLLATLFFVPLEVHEVLAHVTPLRVGGLLLNIVICAYLIWRKRLFLERPGPEPQPA